MQLISTTQSHDNRLTNLPQPALPFGLTPDEVADRVRRGPLPDLELDETLDDGTDDPAETAAQHSTQARARSALWRLTPDQRQVILLKYFEGLSHEEVAAALGKPIGAIKALQHRALDSMRRVLSMDSIGEML
jgi:RNA polymerase sigma-70 factor (ECF subfamily)